MIPWLKSPEEKVAREEKVAKVFRFPTFRDWQRTLEPYDHRTRYGHYIQFSIIALLQHEGWDIRGTTEDEDLGGDGDMWMYTKNGEVIKVDIKSERSRRHGFYPHEDMWDVQIPNLWAEQSNAGNVTFQDKIIGLFDALESYVASQ